ncbi:MAG: hypothetical protein ACLFSQ_10610, partial [Candidatus Zixiibacteriota bacterium]
MLKTIYLKLATVIVLAYFVLSPSGLYAIDISDLSGIENRITVRYYQNRDDSEPILTSQIDVKGILSEEELNTRISDLFMEVNGEAGSYFIEISSGDDIIVAREPIEIHSMIEDVAIDEIDSEDSSDDIMSPMEDMVVGIEIGQSGEDANIVSDKVGIATASPEGKLHIEHTGTIGTTSYNMGNAWLRVGPLGFDPNEITTTGDLYITGQNFVRLGSGSNNSILHIDPSERVGIGTTSPGNKLEVNGQA